MNGARTGHSVKVLGPTPCPLTGGQGAGKGLIPTSYQILPKNQIEGGLKIKHKTATDLEENKRCIYNLGVEKQGTEP